MTFTKQEFTDWVKTKPENESYCYLRNDNCPIAQFLVAKGCKDVMVSGFGNYSVEDEEFTIPKDLCDSNGCVIFSHLWNCIGLCTFGELYQFLVKSE